MKTRLFGLETIVNIHIPENSFDHNEHWNALNGPPKRKFNQAGVGLKSDNLTGHSASDECWSKWHKRKFKLLFYFKTIERESSLTSSHSYSHCWKQQPNKKTSYRSLIVVVRLTYWTECQSASCVLLFIRLTVIRPAGPQTHTELSHQLPHSFSAVRPVVNMSALLWTHVCVF